MRSSFSGYLDLSPGLLRGVASVEDLNRCVKTILRAASNKSGYSEGCSSASGPDPLGSVVVAVDFTNGVEVDGCRACISVSLCGCVISTVGSRGADNAPTIMVRESGDVV